MALQCMYPYTLRLETWTKTPVTHLAEVTQIQISKFHIGLDSGHIGTSLPFEYQCKTPELFHEEDNGWETPVVTKLEFSATL